MKKKKVFLLASTMLCMALGMGTAAAETESLEGQSAGVIEIATADELKAVNDNLSANYVLTADIDLEGTEWTPLGSFIQMGEEGEEAETPDPEYAFTGIFDGQGHTISNFTINQPESWALGLFGCIANAEIGNFNVDHAFVDGTTMASAVAGYAFCSTVSGVKVSDAVIIAHASELSEEGMYGGIAGAGMMSRIENCEVAANIEIPDNTANAGLVGGGLELTSVTGSTANGTITAGSNCYGIGGISGCGFGAEEFTDCVAENITINTGDNCFWIGGLTGYAGGFEEEEAGIPVTDITGCTVRNVSIQTGEEADGTGEIVGAGFYMEGLADSFGMECYANPTVFIVNDCITENVVIKGSTETAGDTVFAGGNGTKEDPWQIETPDQLLAINENLGASYVLTADLDLSDYENWPMIGSYVMDPDSEEGEDPVAELAFSGTFDGAGHSISNLKIDASEDPDHMFGVGLFSCVVDGGVVKDLIISDIDVKGMMLVGGVIGYAFNCTVDNVDIVAADPENTRNRVESTMVMAGGTIGGLTCSECLNCDVEYMDIIAAPGGNCGVLGGGFSKPVLKNCTVKNSSVKGEMGEVPMFGMTQGSWIGGLTGCVNLGKFDPDDWYVEGCIVEDVEIEVTGKGSHVGALTGSGGTELQDEGSGRMRIAGCEIKNVSIITEDQISCVGGIIGGGLSEGEPPHSFVIDNCKTSDVSITTDTEDLQETMVGLLVGQSRYCQFIAADGSVLDITQRDIPADSINSTVDVVVQTSDGTVRNDAELVGEVIEDNGILNAIAGENGTTYENFFDVTLAEENNPLWYDCTAAIVGESAAEETVAFMQGYISSEMYGEDAITYYTENTDALAMFDCFYINGVKLVTFNPDNTITVQLEDGNTETHTYEYLGVYNVGEGETMVYMGQEISPAFPCDVYKSMDEAGEFNYFFLRDDTMEETGHIEFRYGKDLEELQGYFTGPYAYWLTAGFDVEADKETLKDTVELFVLENMDYSSHSEEALSQLSDFIGTWNADLSVFGEDYADTELFFTIDENGHGITMMDGEQTADFEAYAFDNGEKGDGAGIYIAYSNLDHEAEAAGYTLETDDNGGIILTLYAKNDVISYRKAA